MSKLINEALHKLNKIDINAEFNLKEANKTKQQKYNDMLFKIFDDSEKLTDEKIKFLIDNGVSEEEAIELKNNQGLSRHAVDDKLIELGLWDKFFAIKRKAQQESAIHKFPKRGRAKKLEEESKKQLYMAEVGILLTKDDKEFNSYNIVFDKKYGYYNENICFFDNLNDAKEYVLNYVDEGVIRTYGVVSNAGELDTSIYKIENGNIFDIELNYEVDGNDFTNFNLDDVVYSCVKLSDDEIVEDFIHKDLKI